MTPVVPYHLLATRFSSSYSYGVLWLDGIPHSVINYVYLMLTDS
jgi:hypothetical protein